MTTTRVLGAAAVLAVVASAAFTAPGASAATTGSAPQAKCTGHWKRTGTLMIDSTSPWFTTAPDVNNGPRGIQFHAASGYSARYQHTNCKWGPGHDFPTAGTYRVRSQTDGVGGWATISSGPKRNYYLPDKCVGYDELTTTFRHWSC